MDNYIFLKYLGKGSSGYLVSVQNKNNKRIYALKILNEVSINDIQKQIQEIKIMGSVSHENIIKYYFSEYLIDKENLLIFMELADFSLFDVRKELTEAQADKILFEICRGLQHLHKLKIIHRDLKPGNILLKDGKVKLCDFGISKTCFTNIFEARSYLAPEVIKGENYNHSVDIWAIGIVYYQMLNKGQLLFENIFNNEAINKEIQKNIEKAYSRVIVLGLLLFFFYFLKFHLFQDAFAMISHQE